MIEVHRTMGASEEAALGSVTGCSMIVQFTAQVGSLKTRYMTRTTAHLGAEYKDDIKMGEECF